MARKPKHKPRAMTGPAPCRRCPEPATCPACKNCPRHCGCRRKAVVTYRGVEYHVCWEGKTRGGARRALLLRVNSDETVWAATDDIRGVYAADDGRGIPGGS